MLHSFLHYRVGDGLRYTRYGFSKRAVLAEALFILFFVQNVTQRIWSSCSDTLWLSDTPIFW